MLDLTQIKDAKFAVEVNNVEEFRVLKDYAKSTGADFTSDFWDADKAYHRIIEKYINDKFAMNFRKDRGKIYYNGYCNVQYYKNNKYPIYNIKNIEGVPEKPAFKPAISIMEVYHES